MLTDDANPTPLLLPPGQMLKHFRVEDVLGEGGMGLVYSAFDTQLHRPVAIKLLSSDLTSDPDRKQRLLHEARAAARIRHPAIAQIYYVDEHEGNTFIVMELVEGKTVRDLIQNHELDLLGAIDIAIQVSEGLAKAQTLGIVHRDIKPANVMFTPDGHVKILDFGLAKRLDHVSGEGPTGTKRIHASQVAPTQSGVLKGTPAYMSPEQVRGQAVDGRADIFSLGVLLFEMATGQSPFARDNFMDSLHAAAFAETPVMNSIRPQIPDGLQRIVSRCLKKDPQERFTDAKAVAEDLRRLRREMEAGLAHKTTWRQRLMDVRERLRSRPASRYLWFAAGSIALGTGIYFAVKKFGRFGFVLLVFAGYYLYRHVRNRPHQVQEGFVQRVSMIPEVRLIAFQDGQFTVWVDRPMAQLYGRINGYLRSSNRRLYFGRPMTVSLQHELAAEPLRKLLASPGVQYVRPDVVGALQPPVLPKE